MSSQLALGDADMTPTGSGMTRRSTRVGAIAAAKLEVENKQEEIQTDQKTDDPIGRKRRSRSSTPANGDQSANTRSRGGTSDQQPTMSSRNRSNGNNTSTTNVLCKSQEGQKKSLNSDQPDPEISDNSVEVLDSDDSSESAMLKTKHPTTNGPKVTKRRRKTKSLSEDLKPPKTLAEFAKQVKDNLRTKDGKFCTVVDDRSIRCICGKIVRTCGKFYWKYMVQRPTIKNGQIIQKGHWFRCPAVIKSKSLIPNWIVTEEELEKSKLDFMSTSRNGVDETSAEAVGKVEKRRGVRKRVPTIDKVDLGLFKRSRDADTDSESDDDDDEDEEFFREEVKIEMNETQARFRVKKLVADKLATRIPNEVFLQDGPCFQMVQDSVLMCHTCKSTDAVSRLAVILSGTFSTPEDDGDISCCFFAFRKLRTSKSGHVIVAGYLDPQRDPKEGPHKNDVALWMPNPDVAPFDDVEKAKFILSLIGDQFCDMVRQERKCLKLHAEQLPENRFVAWKPAVCFVREMCDVCKTTIFNYHWTCGRCGIFVCLDCYQFRVGGLVKDHGVGSGLNEIGETVEDKDEYSWPFCTNGETHSIPKLLMAQIIPKNVLTDLALLMHKVRIKWKINQFCHEPDELDSIYSAAEKSSPRHGNSKSNINPERASKLYLCQFCPDGAFKWQSVLFKHWVFKHFMDEIRMDLPELPPFQCPLCEYVASSKTMILLHYGITHKTVLKFVENAIKSGKALVQNPDDAAGDVTKPVLTTQGRIVNLAGAFKCPLCSLTLSPDSRTDHLSKHFYDSLSADLPIASPFLCPRTGCQFVGMDRPALLRHFGGFHGMADRYLKEYLSEKGEDCSHINVIDRLLEPVVKTEIAGVECRLCERDDSTWLKHNTELYRHLSETHFSERLMKELEDVPADVRPFKCNKVGCDFSSMARNLLIIHLGLAHRRVIDFYNEALGYSEEEIKKMQEPKPGPSPKPAPSPKLGPSPKPIKSPKVGPSPKIGRPPKMGALPSPNQSPVAKPVPLLSMPLQPPVPKNNSEYLMVEICPICGLKFGSDALLYHAADQHFKTLLAESHVATTPPYKCPRCPHCSQNRLSILRHWLIFHRMLEVYAAAHFNRPPPDDVPQYLITPVKDDSMDSSSSKVDDPNLKYHNPYSSASDPTPSFGEKNPQPTKQQQCLMCDDIKVVGATPLDLHKHLVEKHFRERLLALIPSSGISTEGKQLYACPFQGCLYEHHYKWIIAKHYGVKHRIAIQFYEQVLGLKEASSLSPPPNFQEAKSKPELGSHIKSETREIVSEMMTAKVKRTKQKKQTKQTVPPPHIQQQLMQPPAFDNMKSNDEDSHYQSLQNQVPFQHQKSPEVHYEHRPTHPSFHMIQNSLNPHQAQAHHQHILRMAQPMQGSAPTSQHQQVILQQPYAYNTSQIQHQPHLQNPSHPFGRMPLPQQETEPLSHIHSPQHQLHSQDQPSLAQMQHHAQLRMPQPQQQQMDRQSQNPRMAQPNPVPQVQMASYQHHPHPRMQHPDQSFQLQQSNSDPRMSQSSDHLSQVQMSQFQMLQHPNQQMRMTQPTQHISQRPIQHPESSMLQSPPNQLSPTRQPRISQPNSDQTQPAQVQMSQIGSNPSQLAVPNTVPLSNNPMQPTQSHPLQQIQTSTPEQHPNESEDEYSMMTLSNRLSSLDEDDDDEEEEEEEDDDCDLDETAGLSTSESELVGAQGNDNHSLDDSFSGLSDSQGNQLQTYDCKICAVKSRGITDFLRHLSKVHFKRELLSFVPKLPPFRCPWNDCSVTKKDRYNIAIHYGMAHKVALNLMQDMPEDALNEDVEATCKLCHQSFTAHRYLYTHLSDTHFMAELEADLPKSGPWKCPKCPYIGNDPRALRVHYGVRHKVVLNHLAKSLGMNAIVLKKEMKAVRKKAVSALKASLTCKFCPSHFKDSADMERHQVLHLRKILLRHLTDREPFKCPNCDFVAPERTSLLLHYGIGHPNIVKDILSQPHETLDIDMSFVDPHGSPTTKRCGPTIDGPMSQQNRRPAIAQPSQRQIEEDKKFPKCRICNYRYFTRLDLCRHFVDYHLRQRIAGCIDTNNTQCPSCVLTYEKQQSRLRHFIWSHQDLERLVIEDFNVRLSEFMPSSRDLEMVRQKNERRNGGGGALGEPEIKELSDLAALPVYDKIDLKLNVPSCELCGEEFKTSVNKARDKSVHLLGHFREEVTKILPHQKPFKCPKCTFIGRDLSDLSRHFGLSHRLIFLLMQRELGDGWELDENETNDCKVCGQVFANSRLLNDHYCAQHFYQKLAEGLPTTSPFKCPQCNFQSKTQLALVRHVGAKHRQIKKLLLEDGISCAESSGSDAKSRSSSTSQDMPLSPGPYSTEALELEDPVLQQSQPIQSAPVPQPEVQAPLAPQPPAQQLPAQQALPVNLYEQAWSQPSIEQSGGPPQYSAYQVSSPYHHSQYVQVQQSQQQQNYTPEHHPPYGSQQPTYQQAYLSPNPHQQQQVLVQHQPQSQPQAQLQTQVQTQHQAEQHLQQIHQEHVKVQQQNQIFKPSGKTDPMPVACPICHSTFLNSTHFLRHCADKHFVDRLRADLPHFAPFRCPMCNFEGKDVKLLVRHYGINHKMVLKILNERVGNMDCFDETILRTLETQETNRETCPLCSSNFAGRYMLLRHLADCHFREKLCQGVQQGEVYKCPECNHASKDKGGFVRHYGLVHKMVQKWLREMGIHGFDDDKKTASNRNPPQPPPVQQEIEKRAAPEHFQEMRDAYEPNPGFFDSPSSVTFAPSTTPSSTASFNEQPPSVYVLQNTQAGNQYYSSPPAVVPASVAVPYDPSSQGQTMPYSPAMHRPASQPPPRPYSSSSNPLTSPPPQQLQQQSPQNLSRESGYPSPHTPGSGYTTPASSGYDSYYGQPQDLSRPQPVDFTQGQSYFSQPNGPVGRPMAGQQSQPLQRYPQQHPQPTGTPQPMTPQPMTPGSHGAQTPQPPLTPHDGGMISPAPYSVGSAPNQQSNFYNVQQPLAQQQLAQAARPQQNVMVQNQSQAQPSVPQIMTPQPPEATTPTSPESQSNSAQGASKSNSRSQTYVPPGDDYIEAPTPDMKGPFAIQCNFCRSITKNKSDFYRHLSEKHFKMELARELPQQPPFKCPLHPCTYETKDNTVAPLVKHYGIVHKGVQKYLRGQIAGRYVHHDKNAPASAQPQPQRPPQMLPTQVQEQQPELINGIEPVQQQPEQQQQQYQIEQPTIPQQVMSNQALKVKCPFCELMFAARYSFHQHLCDKHFKETLAQQVPVHPPYQCPVSGCVYVARDSRQSLIRHFGMTHKVVVELLKRHIPNYETIDPFPNDEQHLQQQQQQAMVQQAEIAQQQQQQQQQVFYQVPIQQQQQSQQQFGQTQHLQDNMMTSYYQEYHSSQPGNQLQPQQQPQVVYTQPHPGNHGEHMRFEPQIDGTFDPSHYSDHSLDGIRSIPTTPIKIGNNGVTTVVLPPPDPNLDDDSLLLSLASTETETVIQAEVKQVVEAPPTQTSTAAQATTQGPVYSKGSPKLCEICLKQFDGKNRAMLKVQHMAHHFKDKLFADLKDKSSPFKCPVEGCNYQTKHKPDWARHYGSVHQFIGKYLKEYLDEQQKGKEPEQVQQEPTIEQPTPPMVSSALPTPHEVTDGERTYSAFLPKADLNQIINTAMNQQSQPDKNFGVVTINSAHTNSLDNNSELNFVNQVIQQQSSKLETEEMESHQLTQQCFLCSAWFKDEKDLTNHMSSHIELSTNTIHHQEPKPTKLEVLSTADLEASLIVKDDQPSIPFSLDQTILPSLSQATELDHSVESALQTSANHSNVITNRSTGRPCELCGFEPKTKNKSRERQDHLAMKHYRERIQNDLAAVANYKCPMCEYIGRDKQTIYRHYTGKHKVVEQYLADDLAAGRVIPVTQQQIQVSDGHQIIPSLPTGVESLSMLQNFDLGSGVGSGGLDLTVHSLVDSRLTLAEFMDHEGLGSHERIMQVDGADDDDDDDIEEDDDDDIEEEDDDDFEDEDDDDIEEDEFSDQDPDSVGPLQFGQGAPNIFQYDGADDNTEEQTEFDAIDGDTYDDSSNTSAKCPLCDESTKLHKTYHYAMRHFKQRLIETLVGCAEAGLHKCPDCSTAFRTRINLWTHYLGKHKYADKWIQETLGARQGVKQEFKQESLDVPDSPMPNPFAHVNKSQEQQTFPPPLSNTVEFKSESSSADASIHQMDEGKKAKTQKKPRVFNVESIIFSGKRLDFWCDLCQSLITNSARTTHYANIHFEPRLRIMLPTSGVFSCPLCKHEGKNFLNLSTHFLGRHTEFMKKWHREELDKLEAAAFEAAKQTNMKHELSSGEEVDTSDDESNFKVDPNLLEALQRLKTDKPQLMAQPKVRPRIRSKRLKTKEGIFGFVHPGDPSDSFSKIFWQKFPNSRNPIPTRTMTLAESAREHPTVPHVWLCNGKLLVLEDPTNPDNVNLFQEQWIRGQPVIVANVSKHLDMSIWTPEAFSRQFGHIRHDIVNTKSNKIIPKVPLKMFWDGFENLTKRIKDEFGNPMLLKLKDWPPDNDFKNYLPERFSDLMRCIPLPDYTKREGRFNLASCMPDFFVRPDLGPKMYIAYGNALYPNTGTTNLHIDMSDACNLMVYVSVPKDGSKEEHIREGLKSVEEADCDIVTRQRVRDNGDSLVGAIWHIYHPRDADKIRDMLNKVAIENGQKLEPNTDPIHDQNLFLDSRLRQRLYKEYGVIGYAIAQCEGEVVFIPAGAPHQVRNVHNCIKVAEDFVSPENLEWCFYQTEEFRHLSEGHTNHEDKLQIKNILFHAVKDCVSVLQNYEKNHNGQTC